MKTGVLLANLGTPDAPTTSAVRRYLREFLSDRRVIDLPRWKWLPILHLFVLTSRPKRSAEAYRRVWTEEGSPLLVIGRSQAAGLAERLGVPVALGMRYGNPSLETAIDELRGKGCERICLLPLYPQYSRTTTESTFDAVRRHDLVRVEDYHCEPLYIGALAASVREAWTKGGEPERLLVSFHGIPERYARDGDPYPDRCRATKRLLADELGLADDRCTLTFQSRFGREEWLKPYTDETLRTWGRERLASVDVICPGFAADCLETLDEIAVENGDLFVSAGGGRLRYIAALNDRADHLDALAAVVRRVC